jgi:hypothetical protein
LKIIFDSENNEKLNSISLFRFFYNDSLRLNPKENPKVTGLKESLVSFQEATEDARKNGTNVATYE